MYTANHQLVYKNETKPVHLYVYGFLILLYPLLMSIFNIFIGSIINVGVTPLRCHFQHYFLQKK